MKTPKVECNCSTHQEARKMNMNYQRVGQMGNGCVLKLWPKGWVQRSLEYILKILDSRLTRKLLFFAFMFMLGVATYLICTKLFHVEKTYYWALDTGKVTETRPEGYCDFSDITFCPIQSKKIFFKLKQ